MLKKNVNNLYFIDSGMYRSSTDNRFYIFSVGVLILCSLAFSNVPGLNYYVNIFGMLVAVFFLFKSFQKGFMLPIELIVYFLFILWSLTGFMVCESFLLFRTKLQTMFLIFVMVMIISHATYDINAFLKLTVYTMLGLSLVGISGLFGFDIDPTGDASSRLAGLSGNSNGFAALMLYVLLLLFMWFEIAKHKIFKICIILAVPVVLKLLIESGSKKGFVGFFLILFMWFFLNYPGLIIKKPALFLLIIILIVSLMFFAIHNFQDSPLLQRFINMKEAFEGGGSDNQTDIARFELIKEGLRIIRDNFLVGVGLDNFRVHSNTHMVSHNNYISVFCSTGLIGGVLYYSIYLLIFLRLHRCRVYCKTNKVLRAIWCFGFIHMVLLLFLEIGIISLYAKFIWVFLALIISVLYHIEREKRIYVSM